MKTKESARSLESSEGTSGDRLLSIISLFSVEKPEWTIEEAARELDFSPSTTYRYFRSLAKAGLISPLSRASYVLGPAIIELDRQIQICDPMLNAARGVMLDLIQYAAEGSIILLCRRYSDRVLCEHQVFGRGPQDPVSYERGRPMPLFRGATSKIILAHLPGRTLSALFSQHHKEIAEAGLGRDLAAFKKSMSALRRAGICVSHGEVDAGRVGISAPVFNQDRAILGSLSFVLPAAMADEKLIGRLIPLTTAGAREIEEGIPRMSNRC